LTGKKIAGNQGDDDKGKIGKQGQKKFPATRSKETLEEWGGGGEKHKQRATGTKGVKRRGKR